LLRGNDGKLYITTGDASHSENSQDLSNLHGKVIRIDTDGTIPDDNPFVGEDDTYHCSKFGGSVPGATGKCLEIFAYGLRNPFRVAMDPSEITKTKFVISDVGADTWEELDPAGTDYAGANYGFPEREGPCAYQSKSFCYTKDDDSKVVDPIHFYLHYKDGRTSGAAVGAAAFVPNSIGWPSDHSFLVSDFIFQEVYSLTEDNVNECGDECDLPVSRFGNTTFFQSIGNDGDDYNAPRIVDIFFGPYKDTQALYIVRYGSSYQSFDNIIRIRYTGLDNDPPIVKLDVEGENFPVGSSIAFSALESKDPEGGDLKYRWFFGDGETSTDPSPIHKYTNEGHYKVTLIVTDDVDQSQQQTEMVTVGTPPKVSILSPIEGQHFAVGEVLQLNGLAVGADGNLLEASQLRWSARKHQ
jgi:Glucose / Sorbosone dehydrogenase/PKD domain